MSSAGSLAEAVGVHGRVNVPREAVEGHLRADPAGEGRGAERRFGVCGRVGSGLVVWGSGALSFRV